MGCPDRGSCSCSDEPVRQHRGHQGYYLHVVFRGGLYRDALQQTEALNFTKQ